MFFVISKQIQSSHRFGTQGNAAQTGSSNSAGGMILEVGHTCMRGALFTVYSAKAFAQFRDEASNKIVPKRKWTAEMQTAAASKVASAAKPPFIFKLTMLGWVFAAVVVALFCYLTYSSMKPAAPMPAEYSMFEKAPAKGDRYFGSYENYKGSRDKRIPSSVGFSWFKVVGVEGDRYLVAQSTDVSPSSRPKEDMNSEDFASESVKMKITEQHGYDMRMQTEDGLMKIYFTGKK